MIILEFFASSSGATLMFITNAAVRNNPEDIMSITAGSILIII